MESYRGELVIAVTKQRRRGTVRLEVHLAAGPRRCCLNTSPDSFQKRIRLPSSRGSHMPPRARIVRDDARDYAPVLNYTMDSFVWDHLLPKQGYVVVCRNGSIKRVYALPGFASSMCRLTSELDNENVAGTEIEASDTRGLSESNFIRDAGMTCAMMAAAMSSGGLKATASMRAGFPHKPFLAGVPSRRKQPCIPSVAMASAAPRTAPTEEQAMRLCPQAWPI